MSSEAAPEVVSATASTTPADTPSLKGGGVPGGGGGGTTTAEQQQVPFQMIPPGHFFANPFMNPYVPSGVPQQQEAGEPSGVPQPNQMVFSPAQYQEVMHHYFQQMMAASGAQFPIPFPMQFQPAFQQPRPSSQASSSHRSEDDNGRQTAGSVGCVSSNVSPNHRETKPEGSKEASKSPETQEPSNSEDTLVPTSSDVAVGDVISGDASPESTSPGEEKSEEKRKNSGDRTDSLIRKQMSEMEKEITRRSQNKNIKKVSGEIV
ncbi:hypothetical protein B9Z55_000158 [Caenorhabditis nigoni]|uniref:Uncharacterized protein n=1 Tax=Caenorhabditis nigoni TaxID=1611254 RepID=A0A2G5VGF2_9PELO|nr:hypothetical protein B9Z55_000158 [Caenorhabditis nigoni]